LLDDIRQPGIYLLLQGDELINRQGPDFGPDGRSAKYNLPTCSSSRPSDLPSLAVGCTGVASQVCGELELPPADATDDSSFGSLCGPTALLGGGFCLPLGVHPADVDFQREVVLQFLATLLAFQHP
jgi:hypothetical protein